MNCASFLTFFSFLFFYFVEKCDMHNHMRAKMVHFNMVSSSSIWLCNDSNSLLNQKYVHFSLSPTLFKEEEKEKEENVPNTHTDRDKLLLD